MGEGADRPRDGASSDLLAGAQHPLLGAGELGIGDGELEPERGRLGMDAVAPADGERVLMLEGARFERREQSVEIGDEDVCRLDQLHVEAGVEHV